ncbi:hypothetical protein MHYP_G00035620 [Metynnis hypsauchen]
MDQSRAGRGSTAGAFYSSATADVQRNQMTGWGCQDTHPLSTVIQLMLWRYSTGKHENKSLSRSLSSAPLLSLLRVLQSVSASPLS